MKAIYNKIFSHFSNNNSLPNSNKATEFDNINLCFVDDSPNYGMLLTKNKNKVIYVAPGNYIVDGTIIIPEVKESYCFGNLIGPDNVNKIKTVCGNSKIKAVVYSSKQNVNIYINTITVRHNYTGLYCNGNLCHITVKQIVGEYSEDICPLIDTNMYEQIPDNWYLN